MIRPGTVRRNCFRPGKSTTPGHSRCTFRIRRPQMPCRRNRRTMVSTSGSSGTEAPPRVTPWRQCSMAPAGRRAARPSRPCRGTAPRTATPVRRERRPPVLPQGGFPRFTVQPPAMRRMTAHKIIRQPAQRHVQRHGQTAPGFRHQCVHAANRFRIVLSGPEANRQGLAGLIPPLLRLQQDLQDPGEFPLCPSPRREHRHHFHRQQVRRIGHGLLQPVHGDSCLQDRHRKFLAPRGGIQESRLLERHKPLRHRQRHPRNDVHLAHQRSRPLGYRLGATPLKGLPDQPFLPAFRPACCRVVFLSIHDVPILLFHRRHVESEKEMRYVLVILVH